MESKPWTSHVVIEGPDQAGKTALARSACEVLGYAYHHEGVPEGQGSLLQYYAELLLRDEPTVFDRLHVGEICYGPVMRGSSRLLLPDMVLMDRLVKATGTVVMVSVPPFPELLARWKMAKRPEYVVDETKFKDIWWLFHETKHYTYKDGSSFPDLEMLVDAVRNTESCPRDVVGSPWARFLFVGERCNAEPGEFHLPFFSVRHSAGYLTNCLWEAGFTESDMAFTNALSVDGQEVDLKEKLWREGQVVVALGNVAHDVLTAQGIEHASVQHPQFRKRFYQFQTDDYIAQLREIKNAKT